MLNTKAAFILKLLTDNKLTEPVRYQVFGIVSDMEIQLNHLQEVNTFLIESVRSAGDIVVTQADLIAKQLEVNSE